MRQLQKSTLRRYSERQLAKHLDRLMSEMDKPRYRVDLQYGQIFKRWGDAYLFSCTISPLNRNSILDFIKSVYRYGGES